MDEGSVILPALAGVLLLLLASVAYPLISAFGRLRSAERKIETLEAQQQLLQDSLRAASVSQTTEAPAVQPQQIENIGAAENHPPEEIGTAPAQLPLPPTRPEEGLEEALGTRWAVYIGGVALALGGLLLVRYAIEQGWFGPGARVLLGLGLGFTLVTAGEIMRRREKAAAAAALAEGQLPNLTITPAVLTAAGTVTGFGAIYAAHALYHFVGPTTAFVALGVAGVAAMISAALHGPALARIGLAGALATPLLVQSDTHSAWPVVVYIAVVTVAAYGLSRVRAWLWLALTGAAGAVIWGVILSLDGPDSANANYVHVVIQTVLASLVFVSDRRIIAPEDEAKLEQLPTFGPLALGALTAGVLFSGALSGAFDLGWMLSGAAVVAILAVTGVLVLPAAGVIAGAGVLVLAILWIWPGDGTALEPFIYPEISPIWFTPLEQARFAAFAALGAAFVAGLSGLRLYQGANLPLPIAQVYSGAAALTPLAALALAYLRLTHTEASLPFSAIAGFVALAFMLAASAFQKGLSERASAALNLGLGAMASAALAALALGFVFVLNRGMLTVALALSALGAAMVERRLSIPALRLAVAGLGVLVAGRLAYDPRIVGADLGVSPIFNWLLFGYGVPAMAFGLAARVMRRASGEDQPVQILQALSVMCSALLVFFEIRHALNGGDPYSKNSGLIEEGLFATASLAFSLVLMRLAPTRTSPVLYFASLAFGAISALVTLFGVGLLENPYFSGQAVEGGRFFNAILLSYGLPAVLAIILARAANGLRPQWFVVGARCEALLLFFLLATLQTRRLFETEFIDWTHRASQAENYTYSAVWLGVGIVLLAFGLWRASREARVASGLFIVAAVLKVFLYDLAQLEGILRALSFIGLGVALIGIAMVYQKLVFRPRS
jgi:uncharacterized membrane protein